jgi:hypothetical protein
MKKLKLFLTVMMICLAIPSKAQTSSKVLQNYYIYASIEVRWANKATGEPCFVILISPGENGQQRPSILKNSEGKYVIVRNMMEGLAYLEVQGWELLEPRTAAGIGNWIVRRKTSFEELERLVKANTTYEEVAPKVQLNLSEQTLKVDYK